MPDNDAYWEGLISGLRTGDERAATEFYKDGKYYLGAEGGEPWDADREMVSQGVANIASGTNASPETKILQYFPIHLPIFFLPFLYNDILVEGIYQLFFVSGFALC